MGVILLFGVFSVIVTIMGSVSDQELFRYDTRTYARTNQQYASLISLNTYANSTTKYSNRIKTAKQIITSSIPINYKPFKAKNK